MKKSGNTIFIVGLLLLGQLNLNGAMRILPGSLICKIGLASFSTKRAEIQAAQEILGVASSATFQDIKAAYRNLVMKNHPDQGGSSEAFRKVQEAYEFLKSNKSCNEYKQEQQQEESSYHQRSTSDFQEEKSESDYFVWSIGSLLTGIFGYLYLTDSSSSFKNEHKDFKEIKAESDEIPDQFLINENQNAHELESLISQSLNLTHAKSEMQVVDNNNSNKKITAAIAAGLIIAGTVAYKKGYFDSSIAKVKKALVWCKNKCIKK